ncbi:MAG: hypothetical protein A2Z94_03625 [Gallionellales bacterium GWA2_55_18]|nr:MAG: hypothetical protein A2Z94_03625 [Gallionellales bacterium GWA2_55_18]
MEVSMPRKMTETQYMEELYLIINEVNTAIECFYTYIEIHNYAAEDKRIFKVLNENPTFWNINLYSLQTTFFIVLGRIFDDGEDTHSIHKLLAATVAHSEFFSKNALGARKAAAGLKPDDVDSYIADVFEPQVPDLRVLKKTFSIHRVNYDATYADIRSRVFAHNILISKQDVGALFDKALIGEINNMLYNLKDILDALRDLVQNGRRPEFGVRTYEYQNRIKQRVRKTFDRLVLNT